MTVAPRSIDELMRDLSLDDAEFMRRDQALGELVRRGRDSVPALTRVIASADAELRGRAVRALAAIADPSSVDLFVDLVNDPDGHIRACAASGLARLGDLRAVDALVRTIDDWPNVLHTPTTMSTGELIGMGPKVLGRVAPLLSAPDPITRARAIYVIRAIVEAQPGEDGAARWRELGGYRPDAPDDERERAAEQWRQWIAERYP